MIKGYKRHQLGHSAELASCQYLQQQGLRFIQSNFRCRMGEVDLIMQDKEVWVFVEVRMRSTTMNPHSILESIHFKKQSRILRTALFYLQNRKLLYKVPCRFDIIAVYRNGLQYHFQWIKGAFDASILGY